MIWAWQFSMCSSPIPTHKRSSRRRIYDYFSLSSQRMVLPPEVETAARRAFDRAGGQPVFTYLANRLAPVSDDRHGSFGSPDPLLDRGRD